MGNQSFVAHANFVMLFWLHSTNEKRETKIPFRSFFFYRWFWFVFLSRWCNLSVADSFVWFHLIRHDSRTRQRFTLLLFCQLCARVIMITSIILISKRRKFILSQFRSLQRMWCTANMCLLAHADTLSDRSSWARFAHCHYVFLVFFAYIIINKMFLKSRWFLIYAAATNYSIRFNVARMRSIAHHSTHFYVLVQPSAIRAIVFNSVFFFIFCRFRFVGFLLSFGASAFNAMTLFHIITKWYLIM